MLQMMPLQRKIVDPIFNAAEHHFKVNLNGFSVSCYLVSFSRYLGFKKYANEVSLDYPRITNYINYKIMNISVNNR